MYTVHNALAKILGIDTKGDVIGFDVHAHAGSLVRVVIHKVLLNEAYEMLDPHRMEFELVELTKKPEPFDLDKMCEEANARVQKFINFRAKEIKNYLYGRVGSSFHVGGPV